MVPTLPMRRLAGVGVPTLLALALATALSVGRATAQAVYFQEDFSDNSAGWTLGTEWQIGPAVACPATAGGNGDPGTDTTPTADNGIAGVVIGGYASTGLHDYYWLTSPPIDLSGAPGAVVLRFMRWLNSDYTPYMANLVQVWNGSVWSTVWLTGGPPPVNDNAWTLQEFEVTGYKNAQFQVRFGFNVASAGVFTVSGWNLDDVALSSPVPVELMHFAVE